MQKNKSNYFTSSDPHHDMSGEGCQVRRSGLENHEELSIIGMHN